MEQNRARVEELMRLYLSAESTTTQEEELLELLTSMEQLPQEWRATEIMLRAVRESREQRAPKRTIKMHNPLHPIYRVAAAVVVLFALSVTILSIKQEKSVAYCYLNGEAIYDISQATEELNRALRIIDKEMERHTSSLTTLNRGIEEAANYLEILKLIE